MRPGSIAARESEELGIARTFISECVVKPVLVDKDGRWPSHELRKHEMEWNPL